MEATYMLLLQMCFNLLCKPEVQEAPWPVSWEQFEKWVLRFAPAPWESWSLPKKRSHIFFPVTMVLNWKYIFSPSHYIFSNILAPFMEFIAKSLSGLPSSQSQQKYHFQKTFTVSQTGNCRVMTYCDALSCLVVSQPSPQAAFLPGK